MTSEVVILNKKGLVLAADSAVTTGLSNGNHPRYSKAANKIFDASIHGNVAVTIFGSADIDRVPWELAIKMFRATQVGCKQLPKISDYVAALTAFLKSNSALFPPPLLAELKQHRLQEAMLHVLRTADSLFPGLLDEQASIPDRTALWEKAKTALSHQLQGLPVHPALTDVAYGNAIADADPFIANVTTELANTSLGSVILVPRELAELAISALYKDSVAVLTGYTGLVTAGYGDEEIFPRYQCIHVHGHIGSELLVDTPGYLGKDYACHEINHADGSWIQAFAQSSMIDVFTDGFGYSLRNIIRGKSLSKFHALVDELRSVGVVIPANVSDPIIENAHQAFMQEWQRENYQVNFQPLLAVLGGLSIQEMSHLGENLLTLESLKERVTSPSESVGGPIDIAAITKAEGLVWVKRKHFFDAELNMKYITRTKGKA